MKHQTGELNPFYKHGMKNTRLYRIWQAMKRRCYNYNSQDYSYYGGRGIVVCDEWRNNFQAFYDWAMKNGYHDDLTIDREDVNGNYKPSNCRWSNRTVQSQNQRTRKDNKSGYKGVSWRITSQKWQSQITINGKNKYLGLYNDINEAIKTREEAENALKRMEGNL